VPEFPQYNIPMNLKPHEKCGYCSSTQWKETFVNTSKKMDLFTGKVCKYWRATSTCSECNMITYWHIDPDEPYQQIKNGRKRNK
jgi:hypothetical protein